MLSRIAMGDFHGKAEPQLRNIIARMKDDVVTTTVRYEERRIILLQNSKNYKYRHFQHLEKMIRTKLRRLEHLPLELRKLNENIRNISNLYVPHNFSLFLKAILITKVTY